MDNSIENIWKSAVDKIREGVNPETFDLWFAPLEPLSLENAVFSISVPNTYFAEWIKTRQKENIEKILSDILQETISIDLKPRRDIAATIESIESVPIPPLPLAAQGRQKDQINPKYLFDSFVEGPSNRFAKASCEAVAKNPGKQFNPLFIYGGVGLGKTHLLHAIGNYIKSADPAAKILYATAESFFSEFITLFRSGRPSEKEIDSFKNKYRSLDCLLIDDIQFLAEKGGSQEEFYYVFNSLYDSKKQIVITSDRPPKDLVEIEDRLISRFAWGNSVDIAPPDFETRMAILRQKASDEKIYIPDDVITYIAANIKSNIRELEGSLLKISAFSLLTETPLTLDSVKILLKDIIRPLESVNITVEMIQKAVAAEFNIELRDMRSKKRTDAVAFPRQIAMYLSRSLLEMSTIAVGDFFGGRDHSTVMHACNKIKEKIASDPYFNAKINEIIKKIKLAEAPV
ncbi:MAG: chromosomal replication initiator protein DnaA [Elusimicrobiota bacterium]|jgi:chromosomal replication initiator protein|nr:chromosomal replication initiator protein DnaA [Elusimicrobiota bacterium]